MQDNDAPQNRIDPQIREGVESVLAIVGPDGLRSFSLQERRDFYNTAGAADAEFFAQYPTVGFTDRWIPGFRNEEIRVRVYRSVDAVGDLPGILYIHGGGMNLGSIESVERQALPLTEELDSGAVVVSVDYRLAPEHPHPCPVEHVYAALVWMSQSAAELGVDPTMIALYGGSAGGGLAAAAALLARDRGGPALVFQMLLYPMLDDRSTSASSHEFAQLGIWGRELNLEAWSWLLGSETAAADCYAAPARAEDLSNLPPTYLDVGDLDLFRDENLDFAWRLMRAGVPTELHVYPGGVHVSEI